VGAPMTLEEAARRAGVSSATLRRWVRAGEVFIARQRAEA
jgi:excisionase family DNA binding protein